MIMMYEQPHNASLLAVNSIF